MKTCVLLQTTAILLLFTGCSEKSADEAAGSSANLATPAEMPGMIEGLNLTKDQAREINAWLAGYTGVPARPERYFKFVKSVIRSDQREDLQSIIDGDQPRIAELNIAKVERAADLYKDDCGSYPAKAEDLRRDPGVPGWKGPYFRVILDPWGAPFQLAVVDERLNVTSPGPDRNAGTADDVTN